jgi:DNA-binding NarL/FixJ family response regulator
MTDGCGLVLVVDDDASFRSFVATALQRAGFETIEAADGIEALRCAEERPPTVALLDVQMPGMAGYAACHELRVRLGEELPIIFVSGTRTEPSDRVGGLLFGADDYIVKPFDPDELIARVKRLQIRSQSGHRRPAGGRPASPSRYGLTPREDEVLGLLVDGRNQGGIARHLVISPKTVSTHLQRILAKLGVHSRAQAVAVVARDQRSRSLP